MAKRPKNLYQVIFKGSSTNELVFCHEVTISFPFITLSDIITDANDLHKWMVSLPNVTNNSSFIKYRDSENIQVPHYSITQIEKIKLKPIVSNGVVPING